MGKPKKYVRASAAILAKVPRCVICGGELVLTCDRTKPSELVEWKGMEWSPQKPEMINFYPTAKEQEMKCHYHKVYDKR